MATILLLSFSNVFMTFAWYGHLKYGHDWPLWKAILISWMIARVKYCLAVPANRFGYGQFSGFQLKIIQEVVTLVVFMGFAVTFLKERAAWNHLVAFAFSAPPHSSPSGSNRRGRRFSLYPDIRRARRLPELVSCELQPRRRRGRFLRR